MSAQLASIWGLVLLCALTFRESAPLRERAAFCLVLAVSVLAVTRETGRLVTGAARTGVDRGAEIAAFLAFMAYLALYACRLLILM